VDARRWSTKPGSWPSGALSEASGELFCCLSINISRREPRLWSAGGANDARDGLLIRGCYLPQWRPVKPASALLLPSDILSKSVVSLVESGRGGRGGSKPWILLVRGCPSAERETGFLAFSEASGELFCCLSMCMSRREPRWWSAGGANDVRDGLLIRGCFLPR